VIGGAVAAVPVAYGVSDYLGGSVSREVRPTVVIVVGRWLVVPVLAVAAPLTGEVSVAALVWGAAAGVPLYLGFVWLFAALSAGPMAVAAPVIALTAAGVPIVVGVALGASMPALAWVGVAATVAAVLLLNRAAPGDPAPAGGRGRAVVLAVGAGAALGGFTVLTSRTGPETGLWPLLAAQLVAWAVAAAVMSRIPSVWPRRGLWAPLAGAAVFELAGDVAALVVARHNLALVGPALALQPATTILLARLFAGEAITRARWVGLAASGAAMLLLTTA
jgi:drug/metabolite transporter (DMT)-like permease